MPAVWKYYTHASNSGAPLAELALSNVSIEDVLSGTGTLTGSLDLYDPMSSRAYCAPWLHEITATRDDVIAFHGPIVSRIPRTKEGVIEFAAATPQAYLYKRFTEGARTYKKEQFQIIRDMITNATAKTNGALYRFAATTNNSGVTVSMTMGGSERQRVSDLIENMSKDAAGQFDFRWDYAWFNFAAHTVTRTLTLGYPLLGRDLSTARVVESSTDLVELVDVEDGMRAANRVHVMGAGAGVKRLRAVGVSANSIGHGYPLLEEAFDHTEVKSQSALQGIANHIVGNIVPNTRHFTSTHTISAEMPFGFVDLGDTVQMNIKVGVEQFSAKRRVVKITTDPQLNQQTFTYIDPLGASY